MLRLFVFDSDYARDISRNGGNEQPLFTITSQLVLRYLLEEKYAKAKVERVYLFGRDVADVVINPDELEEYDDQR